MPPVDLPDGLVKDLQRLTHEFVEANYNSPEVEDYLLIFQAMLKAAILVQESHKV
jgi:hypothetical protein